MTNKMVMIAYNEAIDAEVMEALEASCALDSYTKIPAVFGKGKTSGTHLGDDIWPGRNNLLMVCCTDSEAKKLMEHVQKLHATLGKEGIKAFVLAVEAE
ncbi:MAG TPA: hypothetical protein PK562_02830, partial [Candidatus Omnitrophota bacterium]|nr:hypothetical protein [Candidatus Omnitrophota bacterium]